jgi:two-component system, probable response regulator PhcQ
MSIVMIVDDDRYLLDSLLRILRHEPYSIVAFQSCEEALSELQYRTVDVVISDQELPGMRGSEFLQRVQALYPATTRFMLTGRATLDGAVEAINKGGISRYFIKPCDSMDLIISIRQGIQQHQLMVAARRLLKENERKSALLQKLEVRYPNITKVECDSDGVIDIEEFHGDPDQLLKEIERHLGPGKK